MKKVLRNIKSTETKIKVVVQYSSVNYDTMISYFKIITYISVLKSI